MATMQRRLSTRAIAASLRGRRWLVLFLLAAIITGLGAVATTLPLAEVVIQPALQTRQYSLVLKIDVGLSQSLPEQGIVTGVAPATADERVRLKDLGYIEVSPEAGLLVSSPLMRQAVAAAVARAVQPEELPIADKTSWTTIQLTRMSPTLWEARLLLEFVVRRRFDLAAWRQHLTGISVAEAELWLRQQPGVDLVNISLIPSFLAKISQKMPRFTPAITLTLDVKGKTTILE